MKLFWNEPGRRKRRRVWKRYAGMGTADPAAPVPPPCAVKKAAYIL